ncbi:MAG: hypothetical protein A2X56_04610 [Nitrospirae bacterium GWC2_57_13]|nr:MAG: hypothetical protein A2X56_04610 [Nitrospirae bacterium GWC2_57_13]OGW41002.1 MAG: hypothetical protein A2X57_02075 [Nitrospirae bacterium GWD2_57_8]HAS55252.1 hypothetical protein [Nitrospiraceae bacterium]
MFTLNYNMHLTYFGYYGNFSHMSATVKSKTMKTFPLDIEESLHKALKHKAIETNMSLHAYIIDALVSRVSEETTAYNSGGKVEEKRRKR